MSKPKTQPVGISDAKYHHGKNPDRSGSPLPLSGSKKVKNRNHSHDNHGEGH